MGAFCWRRVLRSHGKIKFVWPHSPVWSRYKPQLHPRRVTWHAKNAIMSNDIRWEWRMGVSRPHTKWETRRIWSLWYKLHIDTHSLGFGSYGTNVLLIFAHAVPTPGILFTYVSFHYSKTSNHISPNKPITCFIAAACKRWPLSWWQAHIFRTDI